MIGNFSNRKNQCKCTSQKRDGAQNDAWNFKQEDIQQAEAWQESCQEKRQECELENTYR